MKILLTGSTPAQCGRSRKRYYGQNKMSSALFQMLSEFADVDWADVGRDTDFGRYDAVVSGIGSLRSVSYPLVMPAIYAVQKAKNAIVYVEDWRTMLLMREYRAAIRRGYGDFVGHELKKTLTPLGSNA